MIAHIENDAFLRHAFVRSFFSELGDKTFFLTAMFAAWCPLVGVRSGTDRLFQQFLVFIGAFCALMLRSLAPVPSQTSTREFSLFLTEGFACTVLLILGAKASIELNQSDSKQGCHGFGALTTGNPYWVEDPRPDEQHKHEHFEWNREAFNTFRPAPGPDHIVYNTLAPAPALVPPFKQEVTDNMVAVRLALAILVPLAVEFIAESDDKSQGALPQDLRDQPYVMLSSILGFFPAVFIAVILGMSLERQLSDQRMLFVVTFTMFALSLVTVSQAFLHLGVANLDAPKVVHQALLSVMGVVTGH